MGKLFSRLVITGAALAVVLVRIFRPDIKVDATTVILIGIAASPWLSSVIKGVEVPGGFKLEYRDKENQATAAPPQSDKGSQSQTEWESTRREIHVPQHPALPDDYFSRLVKLTPVETIALFVILSSLIRSTPIGAGHILDWMVFGFLLVMTPLFSRKLGVRWPQAVAMMVAFFVWIFAIGGPFAMIHWYRSWYGGIVLAAFMSVLPLFQFE